MTEEAWLPADSRGWSRGFAGLVTSRSNYSEVFAPYREEWKP
jgi:hypothetical protein